jgi:8-amino-7-oxononanoate synthase
MNRVDQYLSGRLQERVVAGNIRTMPGDAVGVDFRSNDYLGIATNRLLENIDTKQLGTGSTGARLIAGNSRLIDELELFIASFHQAEAALLFNSGFDANTGLLTAIGERNTTFIYDELCHASIIDGIRHSLHRQKYKFAHNDPAALETLLQKYSGHGPVIVTVEAVYSMDGDVAPLMELVEVCEKYEAQLIVDEAHATGVVGDHGEGLVCALGLQERVYARVHTFGKALGCHGAAVVGSRLLRDYLMNFARPFIFTTSLPPHSVQAIMNAYKYLSGEAFSNKPLYELVDYFRGKIAASGLAGFKDSVMPIQAFVSGGNEPARNKALILQQSGLLIIPIFYPTVPKGSERLRICLHTFNTRNEIDKLFNILSI